MNNDSLQNMRKDYIGKELTVSDFHSNPIHQFEQWFNDALSKEIAEPNAFVLSTVNEQNEPNSRVVLIKEIRPTGIVFYTNYESEKGIEISKNPLVAANFFWQPISRQVRIKGICSKLSSDDSDAYYNKRPLSSRIGAITSPQSKEIESREWLMNAWKKTEEQYGEHPTRPDYWGGYLISFTEIEFWQGQPSRLHDRFRYTQSDENNWSIIRLAP